MIEPASTQRFSAGSVVSTASAQVPNWSKTYAHIVK
jgi:hypothetical protein